MPALGARRRAQALYALGHTEADIAAVAGFGRRLPFRHRTGNIPLRDHQAMCRAYDVLRHRYGSKVAGAAARAVRWGWYRPDEWHGLDIDDPRVEPGREKLVTDLSRGACRNHDPEWWGCHDTILTRKAVTICRLECPVLRDCLRLALVTGEEWNTWGGMGEEERRRVLKGLRTETMGRDLLGSPELEYVLDVYAPDRSPAQVADLSAASGRHHRVPAQRTTATTPQVRAGAS